MHAGACFVFATKIYHDAEWDSDGERCRWRIRMENPPRHSRIYRRFELLLVMRMMRAYWNKHDDHHGTRHLHEIYTEFVYVWIWVDDNAAHILFSPSNWINHIML